ncbi:MAG: methyltransferase [Candidatus Promineifilaceae bacterium]
MPIKTNLLEQVMFYTFNAAPGPMLDLAGALSYQAVSAAVTLGIFEALRQEPRGAPDLAQAVGAQERGVVSLLQALEATGYVEQQRDGRYRNTAMTARWFDARAGIDMNAATRIWGVYLRELWPLAAEVIRTGERPYDFYEFIGADPSRSSDFQQMMVGNAHLTAPDIIKKLPPLPPGANLLDVGGGHGVFAIEFCRAYPDLQATIIDTPIALQSARQNVAAAGLAGQIALREGDLWQLDWDGPYDLILLFNLLHHYDQETNVRLLQKTRQALKAGGRLAILEQVAGDVFGSASQAIVRLVALMYYLFADGRVYTEEEFRAMLAESGFTTVDFHSLAKAPGNKLITAVAP